MGNRRRDTPQKPYSPFDNIALVPGALRSPDSLAPRGWADDPESHTLRVSGLGTNVKSSDFDRLFSKERSRWHWMNFEGTLRTWEIATVLTKHQSDRGGTQTHSSLSDVTKSCFPPATSLRRT